MTIERQYGKLIFVCDVGTSARCDDNFETDEEDFAPALAAAQAEGWAAVPLRNSKGFIHHCGKCPRPR